MRVTAFLPGTAAVLALTAVVHWLPTAWADTGKSAQAQPSGAAAAPEGQVSVSTYVVPRFDNGSVGQPIPFQVTASKQEMGAVLQILKPCREGPTAGGSESVDRKLDRLMQKLNDIERRLAVIEKR